MTDAAPNFNDAPNFTSEKCSHGVPLIGNECEQCDRAWDEHVTIPNIRATVHRLLRFYNVETLRELIFAQDHHISKLQAKLPPMVGQERTKVRA